MGKKTEGKNVVRKPHLHKSLIGLVHLTGAQRCAEEMVVKGEAGCRQAHSRLRKLVSSEYCAGFPGTKVSSGRLPLSATLSNLLLQTLLRSRLFLRIPLCQPVPPDRLKTEMWQPVSTPSSLSPVQGHSQARLSTRAVVDSKISWDYFWQGCLHWAIFHTRTSFSLHMLCFLFSDAGMFYWGIMFSGCCFFSTISNMESQSC